MPSPLAMWYALERPKHVGEEWSSYTSRQLYQRVRDANVYPPNLPLTETRVGRDMRDVPFAVKRKTRLGGVYDIHWTHYDQLISAHHERTHSAPPVCPFCGGAFPPSAPKSENESF